MNKFIFLKSNKKEVISEDRNKKTQLPYLFRSIVLKIQLEKWK